jgi:dTDP-4-amino-4,6-dideoxygalactose transaminase
MTGDGILAINGGPKVRDKPMPSRRLFGASELEAVREVFRDSWDCGIDFGYQGKYEKRYTDKFCEFQNGGYADAVSSGTAGIFVALKALDLEAGSDVLVSPVTDPGGVTPVIEQGLNVVTTDARRGSYNVGPSEFEKAITSSTSAAIITHLGGHAVDMDPIMAIANSRGIKVIEDCSQAHGTLYRGNKVGCFGDVAVFSTMYRKAHATGGCGGIVFTRNEDCYWRIRALADRGKPFHSSDYNPKDPGSSLFPAMNFQLDELSCAIGYSTLSGLEATIDRRRSIAEQLNDGLRHMKVVSPYNCKAYCDPSLYFITLLVDVGRLKVSKTEFALAIAEEGIEINPNYHYVVSEWKWLRQCASNVNASPNASGFRDDTFNLLFTEAYADEEVNDILTAISKVESVMAR